MAIEDGYTDEERALFAAGGTPLEPATPPPAPVTTAVPVTPPESTQAGADTAAPAPGNDSITGGAGNDTVGGQPGGDRVTMVPHAALHAERTKNAELARSMSVMTARMNALLQNRPEGTGQPPAMPSIEEDPLAYFQAIEQRLANFENARAEETENRQLDTNIERDEAMFAAYTPDYAQASDHYVKSRAQELLMYYPPEQAKTILTSEVRQIAKQSWQRGEPAAAAIYKLAQARGYTPGAPAAAPAAGGAPAAAPGIPAPPATPGGPAPAAAVAAVLAGQQAGRSLSSGTGADAAAALNAEALLAMSDEEFEQYMKIGSKTANARFAEVAGR